MKNTTERVTDGKITVDLAELMKMLCVGRKSAERIAKEAGAGFNVGARHLYNVKKVQEYIDTLTEKQEGR